MAPLYPLCNPFTIASLALLLALSYPAKILAQDNPTVADCTPRLLPLTPCAPFVQGMTQSPPPTCCDNLRQLRLQQPGCLCLLLNDTNLSSFPINTTLALQLPALCRIQLNGSSCSGISGLPPVPANSPTSQVSLGADTNSSSRTHTNSSVAASPMIQVAPRPVIMGLGLGRSGSIKLKTEGLLGPLVTLSAIFF